MPTVPPDDERSRRPSTADAPPWALTTDHPPAATSQNDTLSSPLADPISSDNPPPIATVPGYELLSELGRGGMGVVYKARQTALNRLVALKMILHANHAGPDERARFKIEAEAVARLQHPHIVQVFEVGEAGGLPYFSLEFCAGGSLDRKLDGTPLPAPEAARLVETLARAIDAAHRAHVVHRDLKPANVLLTADGEPKVTDFGLAKKLDVQGQTQSGAVMGTPSYMAPEQASGQKDVGPAADVYALGAILYELITGRPPFKAASAVDTILQVISDEPVPPRRLQPKLPRDLETICLKCLQKQPARRYASAAALAEDLRRFRGGEPIEARPVARWERGWRWCRRNPMAASLSAALLVVLIAVAVGSTVAAIYLNRAGNEARENAKLADQARGIAETEKEQALFSQYVAEMNLLQRDYEANNIGRVRELLQLQEPQASATDLRNFEWYYWRRRVHQEIATLQGHTELVNSVAFSPDGRRLASASHDRTIRIWDVASAKLLLTINGHAEWVYRTVFSPDGRRLASASQDKTVRVWDAATGKELLVLQGHGDAVRGVTFRRDGQRLASASEDKTVIVWNAVSGQRLLTLKGHALSVVAVCFSPDGQKLASASEDDTVRLWDAATGAGLGALKGHTDSVYAVCFSPDGQRVATASEDKTVRIWDAATREQLFSLKGHADPVEAVCFSPDGRRLASASDDNTVRLWDAETGTEIFTLKGHTGLVNDVVFSPDGRHLASASDDQTVRLWDALTGREPLTFKGNTSSVWDVSLSPEGRRVAAAGADQTVRVWNVETGQEQLILKGHSAGVQGVSFSPDGSRLASAGEDKLVRLWDAATGMELGVLKGHEGVVHHVCFSADGNQLASAGQDQVVRVWDLASKKQVHILKGHSASVMGVSFSSDGRRLVSISQDRTVRLWDAVTGVEVFCLRHNMNTGWGVALSADGRLLASPEDERVHLWDAATGKELRSLKGHRKRVYRLDFSPDGQRLASASEDGTVRIWATATGRELLTLKGHNETLYSLSFSSDGRRLAACGSEGFVRIWEALPVPNAMWRRRGLVVQVDLLFQELLFRREVLAALRKDSTLEEDDRQFALQLAQAHQDDAEAWNLRAWDLAKVRDGKKDSYIRALRLAEAAVHLAPTEGNYLNTLGVVQYRLARYAEALATLQKSQKLNPTPRPDDLAFLAMTLYQLGKKDEATTALNRLRAIMKQSPWAEDTEADDFLEEAKELIEGKANGRRKPAGGR